MFGMLGCEFSIFVDVLPEIVVDRSVIILTLLYVREISASKMTTIENVRQHFQICCHKFRITENFPIIFHKLRKCSEFKHRPLTSQNQHIVFFRRRGCYPLIFPYNIPNSQNSCFLYMQPP